MLRWGDLRGSWERRGRRGQLSGSMALDVVLVLWSA